MIKMLSDNKHGTMAVRTDDNKIVTRYYCVSCMCHDPIGFMLEDFIWNKIAKHKKDILCLNCTRKRIKKKFGRNPQLLDFTDSDINFPIFFGYNLGLERAEQIARKCALDEHKHFEQTFKKEFIIIKGNKS